MQTEQLLCWSGMAGTEHTTTGSNEKARVSSATSSNKIAFSSPYRHKNHL